MNNGLMPNRTLEYTTGEIFVGVEPPEKDGWLKCTGADMTENSVTSPLAKLLRNSGYYVWSSASSGYSFIGTGMVYYNGVYLAFGSNPYNSYSGAIDRSTNGTTWAAATVSFINNSWLYDAVYGNGTWVAVGYTAIFYSTDNGVNWNTATYTATNNMWSVVYGNGIFLTMDTSSTPTILTSSDGITWSSTAAPSSLGSNTKRVGFVNGLFYIYGETTIYSSSDGSTWTAIGGPTPATGYLPVFNGGRWVATKENSVSNTIYWSDDAVNWKTADNQSTIVTIKGNVAQLGNRLTYGNGVWMYANHGGNASYSNGHSYLTSNDGKVWTAQSEYGRTKTSPVGSYFWDGKRWCGREWVYNDMTFSVPNKFRLPRVHYGGNLWGWIKV